MLQHAALLTRILLTILATFGCRQQAFSQDREYYFARFTPASGLASAEINTIFQDSQNLIWIGHKAGISQYDGYDFANIFYAGDKRIGNVYAIAQTGNKAWIAAEAGLFSCENRKFNHIKDFPAVYTLAADNRQRLWAGTADSVFIIDNNAISERYAKPAQCEQVKFISSDYISDGYSIFSKSGNDWQTVFTIKDKRDYITGIHVAGRDTICISSQLSGFRVLSKGQLKEYDFSKGIGNALNFSNGRLLYFSVEAIYEIDIHAGKITQLLSIPEKFREWGTAVLLDEEKNIWIGTHEELLLARRKLFHQASIPQLQGFDELYSVFSAEDGSLLFGGNRGKVFSWRQDQAAPQLWKQVFPLAEVYDMHITATGDKWFCSGYQGLSLLRNGKLQLFSTADGLRNNSNYKFLATSNGNLFVCGDKGITRIETTSDGVVTFKNYFTRDDGVVINCMLEQTGAGLLLGSNKGLLEWRNDSITPVRVRGLSAEMPAVTDTKQDKSGNIWISTAGNGILVCRYDSALNTIVLRKHFSAADGLSAMIYLQLLIDKNNTVWAAGYKEVTAINEVSSGFLVNSFALNTSLPDNSFYSVRMLQNYNGTVHMATTSGLISFDPNLLNLTKRMPVVQLTSIHYQEFAEVFPPQGFQLPYDFGTISFHFTGIYFSDPASLRYAWRLAGDNSWTETGTERTVVFQNLPPGKYVFEVKTAAGNAAWSTPATYSFSVLGPFWQTWWFILTAVISITGLALGLVIRREKLIKNKEAEKTEIEKLKAISYQYQLEIEQVVNYFATVISQQKNIDDLLWDVTRNCMSKLGFEDCVIYLQEESRNMLVQKAAWGPKTTEENKILNPIEIAYGKGIVGHVAQTGKPVIVEDTGKDKRYIVDDFHRLSEIAVPIISDGKVMGVIDSEHSQRDFYTARHLQILTTIAALCADKINKIRAEERTRAKEIEVIKLNTDLVSSQLTALRSQMNPHFIFNSLNSIAQLVASMQNELGLEYLNKFASLLRLILEESESNFISLKDEIRLLDLYLQLESLRFGSSFVYHINAESSLDMEDTMLPSFIIHPIVENAIWHGLLHREGERRLDIGFQKKNNDELLCIVEDNGIGVTAARGMKERSPAPGKPQSKGLKMVHERLHILGQEYNTPANITIEDVKVNGHVGGTKVTIHLPVIYDL